MTKDEILALRVSDFDDRTLDALVSEHVMGIDPRYCTTFNDPIYGDHYNGKRYSTDPSLLETILDRMIELGWLPGMDWDDSDGGWMVVMCRHGLDREDAPQVTSMNLKEAVCKCALLAVMGV